jgi:hypothetical protein
MYHVKSSRSQKIRYSDLKTSGWSTIISSKYSRKHGIL